MQTPEQKKIKELEDEIKALKIYFSVCAQSEKNIQKKTSLMQLSEGKVPDLTPEEFAKL